MASPDHIVVLTDKGSESITADNIKSLKIRFDKKKNVPVFQEIAQTGLDIISDPQYTYTRMADNSGKDVYGNSLAIDEGGCYTR